MLNLFQHILVDRELRVKLAMTLGCWNIVEHRFTRYSSLVTKINRFTLYYSRLTSKLQRLLAICGYLRRYFLH